MAKFKTKRSNTTPAISTASLPDIIFILLFFFMVSTVMREVSLKVENTLPKATELKKLAKRTLVSYIYVGSPINKKLWGSAPKIQLNDAFAEVGDVGLFIAHERANMPESKRRFLNVSLKVDKKTKIGILTDVKQELRKANALRISYAAFPRSEVY